MLISIQRNETTNSYLNRTYRSGMICLCISGQGQLPRPLLFLSTALLLSVQSWTSPQRRCRHINRVPSTTISPFILFLSKIGDEPTSCPSHRWLTMNNLNTLSEKMQTSLETILDQYVDVTVLMSSDPQSSSVETNIIPSYVRLRSSTPLDLISAATQLHLLQSVHSSSENYDDDETSVLHLSQWVASSTLRWCNNFVAASDLNLCPWAKGSLTTPGAVRIKIVLFSSREPKVELKLEQVIRVAANELVRITEGGQMGSQHASSHSYPIMHHNNNDHISSNNHHVMTTPSLIDNDYPTSNSRPFLNIPSVVDSNAAITFVVIVPTSSSSQDRDTGYQDTKSIFHFTRFYNFAEELEDRFLDEEEMMKEKSPLDPRQVLDPMKISLDSDIPVEDVTIAPFHPKWEFASEEEDDVDEDAVNYEKRSPFPTISLVRTKAITKAGEEATERIAEHNEQVLNQLGTAVLNDMYEERIWRQSSEMELL